MPALCRACTNLLKLLNACCGRIGVGRVRTFGHVVVHRVVAPVILRFIEACLVYRSVVERRQYVYGIYAKFLQMLYSLRLCQRQKLTFIYKARRRSTEKSRWCISYTMRSAGLTTVVMRSVSHPSGSVADMSMMAALCPFTPTALANTPAHSPAPVSKV